MALMGLFAIVSCENEANFNETLEFLEKLDLEEEYDSYKIDQSGAKSNLVGFS